MIYEKNVFNQPVKYNLQTYENIEKSEYVREMITQLVVY